jgi:subtilase family serine protease
MAGALLPAAVWAAQPRVTGKVDDAVRVTLRGNTRPEVESGVELGEVEDSMRLEHLQLELKRSEADQKALDAYVDGLTDRSSGHFHQWLTAEEFGRRFGVAEEDIAAVEKWLESHHLEVNLVYANRMTIDFSGTAGEVREAFLTEIHGLEVKGVRHYANVRDPQIPAALEPVVTGVVSLHDFKPRSMKKRKAQYTYGSGQDHAVTPGDLAKIYNLKPLFAAGYTGKGETIAVVEDSNVYSMADWTTFRKTFGLSTYTAGKLVQVHPAPKNGTNNCTNPGVNPDDDEAILDAEYASAAAPGATIELATCGRTPDGILIGLQNLLNGATAAPKVISISYGECEAYNGAASNAAYKTALEQAATEGVSVFVSAGDENAASCDAEEEKATHGISVSALASTPYAVAVGGTDFADAYENTSSTYWSTTNSSTDESAKSYIPEIPWNGSCASLLLGKSDGYTATYGAKGYCNSADADSFGELQVVGGSGGPSGCATGAPATSGVVSGTCKGYAKPAWQSLVGVPADGVRDIPDVSLFASNGIWDPYYVFCFTDPNNGGVPCSGAVSNWVGAGGTSFSAPILAGIQALVIQKWGKQGNPNPVYYKIAAAEYGKTGSSTCNSSKGNAVAASCVFYDVTLGDMDVNCTGTHNCYLDGEKNGVLSTSNSAYKPAYGTTTGWDFATGIGTVNAYNLVFSSKW